MMKSFFVIAIFALVVFCLSSAASIDVDDNEIPESMEAYKSTLESILRDALKHARENSAFDENMVLDNFNQENIFDDEQSVIFTEEEEGEEEVTNDEISLVEDDQSIENVDSAISCSWRGHAGQCCQSLRIKKFKATICLGIVFHPPLSMEVQLKVNGKNVWSKTIGVRNRSFKICIPAGPLRVCIQLYDLHISRHYAKICIGVEAKPIHFHKKLGCIEKRFALHEIPTIKNKPNKFSVLKKLNDKLPSHGYEQNNVIKFEMA